MKEKRLKNPSVRRFSDTIEYHEFVDWPQAEWGKSNEEGKQIIGHWVGYCEEPMTTKEVHWVKVRDDGVCSSCKKVIPPGIELLLRMTPFGDG